MPDPDFESQFDLEFNAGMLAGHHHTNEFIFDSDEGSPLPNRPASPGLDCGQVMNGTPEDYGSPSEALGLTSNTSSPHDSMFDSESSKRTSSTASTKYTFGDMSMDDNGSNNMKLDWNLTDDDFAAMMQPSFNMQASSSAPAQQDVRSPTDSPSPFTFSPDATNMQDAATISKASPQSDAGLSFQTACEDGVGAFTFRSPGPSMPSDVSTAPGASSFSPAALCLRPSQSIQSPPKYEFRGAQQPAAPIAPTMATFPGMHIFSAGPVSSSHSFYQDAMRIPIGRSYEHDQYGPGPYRLEVDANNSKSRVETQIQIRLRLSHLPPGVTKLHLPKHTISKTKLWAKPPAQPSPDMLELHTVLVCTSAMQVQKQKEAALQRAKAAARLVRAPPPPPNGEEEELKPQDGGEVKICEQCIGRERKRAGRKKLKNPEDELAWISDEHRRVIVFNTHEVKDWVLQNPPECGSRPFFQVEAPMRIACYCRHHAEKLGFRIIFTLTDHRGEIIAQTLSPSIMITDDHKNTSPKPQPGSRIRKLSPTRDEIPTQGVNGLTPSLESSPSLDLQAARRSSAGVPPMSTTSLETPQQQPVLAAAAQAARPISRPPSPSLAGGPAKRRKANKSVKIPGDVTMTRLDTAVPSGHRLHPSISSTGPLTPATSPFPPTPPATLPQTSDMSLFGSTAAPTETMPNPFGSASQTPGTGNSQLLLPNLSRSSSFANMNIPMFGAPGPARPNPVSSPNATRPVQATAGAAPPAPIIGQPRPQPQAQPVIFKVIPGEGPIAGGIEVTLMGQGFYNGMHVMFGDRQAPATTFWSSESLVCLLPPAAQAGMVPVTLKEQNPQMQNVATQWFRYVDDTEQQLLRTALMILGNKMTGGYENVADFARRIIKESGMSLPTGTTEMGAEGTTTRAIDSFENHLLKVLELMDITNTARKPRLNLRRSTGHTMLHLACILGLHRFVAGLLARGANPDLRDKGGYTALHLAALHDRPEIVRILINHGADTTLRTLSGLTAADVARSRECLRLILRFEQHKRTQSGSVPHSRIGSVTSLRSLRQEAMESSESEASPSTSSDEPKSEDDGIVFSDDSSSELATGRAVSDESGLRMRRGRSNVNTPREKSPAARPRRRGTEGAFGLPAAAMNLIKEQVAVHFQQLQQMMVPGLQYLPQFPQLPQFSQFSYLPQMPNMPPLPEYQAAVLQRLAAMIGAARPGPDQPGEPTTKSREASWGSSADADVQTPPPAYDELFPDQAGNSALDTKRASVAQAAADAVADAKCAAMFDQPVTSATTSTTTAADQRAEEDDDADDSASQELPVLLHVGRKSAITREQQVTLRRAHARNRKKLAWDRNLFLIWIPLLVLMVCVMIYHGLHGFMGTAPGWRPPVILPDALVAGKESQGNIANPALDVGTVADLRAPQMQEQHEAVPILNV
ncbi:suppressor protein spt23-like protein [Thermochaetoides thermophila DSM 1495]|uniref:Suppressor protein spt23-like protein n=1 Tax=Chaetomium thermophilum (strain DSM 1495 / CBS 144.50 / IMI 039719) TaxID=759272 RepID=G0S009_CHATD|nr:suppressor protein spt23-like protein [Thermochaetoides thermophila DSM 1495]EGS23170.1 suppressor protein spt23-like protein [Thermochaetoides thermophila DSM 1495]